MDKTPEINNSAGLFGCQSFVCFQEKHIDVLRWNLAVHFFGRKAEINPFAAVTLKRDKAGSSLQSPCAAAGRSQAALVVPSPWKGREDGDCHCRQEGADPGCVPPPSSLLLGGGGHHPPPYGARLGDGASRSLPSTCQHLGTGSWPRGGRAPHSTALILPRPGQGTCGRKRV